MPLLVALLASGAGVSCGPGLHDGDEEQSTSQPVGKAGGHIEFMGGKLDIDPGALPWDDVPIRFAWRRAIAHTGALSGVYQIELPASVCFQKDPTLTISTTPEIAAKSHNVIGEMVPSVGDWVPNTSKVRDGCPESTVCGPVQSQIFQTTPSIRLAIVTECYAGRDTPCPSGQSCASSNACQQCPPGSPCP